MAPPETAGQLEASGAEEVKEPELSVSPEILLESLKGLLEEPSLAEPIASSSGGDLEKAISQIRRGPTPFMAFRASGSPQEPRRKPSFAFLALLHLGRMAAIETSFAASRTFRPPPAGVSWSTFRRNVKGFDLELLGSDKEEAEKVKDVLLAMLAPQVLLDVLRRALSGTLSSVEELLSEVLSEQMEIPYSVSVRVNLLSLESLLEEGVEVPDELLSLPKPRGGEAAPPASAPLEGGEVGFDEGGAPRLLVKCRAKLDPAAGIPASEVAKGDLVEAEVDDKDPLALGLKVFLEKTKCKLFPVLENVHLKSGGNIILLLLSERSYGYLPVGGQFRIRALRRPKAEEEEGGRATEIPHRMKWLVRLLPFALFAMVGLGLFYGIYYLLR